MVTSVHPLQIVEADIPMTEHDIPLSAIVSPHEIIETKAPCARPTGIYWPMLPREKIDLIPCLQKRLGRG